jgi:hypothetical protein
MNPGDEDNKDRITSEEKKEMEKKDQRFFKPTLERLEERIAPSGIGHGQIHWGKGW